MNTESPLIIRLSEIKESLNNMELLPLIEQGFLELSSGNAVIPPVGELLFDEPKGDAHIKYGYIQNQPNYVIKIASGFYDNPKLGINSSQGLMLVFSQLTGQIKAVLLDDGYLTDVRTVIASMITLKYLAPKNPSCIGIVGTGTQAKMLFKFRL